MRPAGLAQAFGGQPGGDGHLCGRSECSARSAGSDRSTSRCGAECRWRIAGAPWPAALGSGFRVDAPSERAPLFEQVLADYRRSSGFASIFALIVGLF